MAPVLDPTNLGETLLDEMRRVQRKAWELLARTESEGDHRGSIVALREVRVPGITRRDVGECGCCQGRAGAR